MPIGKLPSISLLCGIKIETKECQIASLNVQRPGCHRPPGREILQTGDVLCVITSKQTNRLRLCWVRLWAATVDTGYPLWPKRTCLAWMWCIAGAQCPVHAVWCWTTFCELDYFSRAAWLWLVQTERRSQLAADSLGTSFWAAPLLHRVHGLTYVGGGIAYRLTSTRQQCAVLSDVTFSSSGTSRYSRLCSRAPIACVFSVLFISLTHTRCYL